MFPAPDSPATTQHEKGFGSATTKIYENYENVVSKYIVLLSLLLDAFTDDKRGVNVALYKYCIRLKFINIYI